MFTCVLLTLFSIQLDSTLFNCVQCAFAHCHSACMKEEVCVTVKFLTSYLCVLLVKVVCEEKGNFLCLTQLFDELPLWEKEHGPVLFCPHAVTRGVLVRIVH